MTPLDFSSDLSGCGFEAHALRLMQALTTIHLLFQTIATRLLRRYTNLVDKAKELEATGESGPRADNLSARPADLCFAPARVGHEKVL